MYVYVCVYIYVHTCSLHFREQGIVYNRKCEVSAFYEMLCRYYAITDVWPSCSCSFVTQWLHLPLLFLLSPGKLPTKETASENVYFMFGSCKVWITEFFVRIITDLRNFLRFSLVFLTFSGGCADFWFLITLHLALWPMMYNELSFLTVFSRAHYTDILRLVPEKSFASTKHSQLGMATVIHDYQKADAPFPVLGVQMDFTIIMTSSSKWIFKECITDYFGRESCFRE